MKKEKLLLKVFKVKYIILYLFLIILTLLMVAAGLLQPYLFKGILDTTIYFKSMEYLTKYIYAFILLFVISQILVSLATFIKSKLKEEILVDIRKRVYESILHMNITLFNSLNTGEILNRILNELSDIISFILESINKIIFTTLTLIAIVVIMLLLNAKLAIIILILSLVFLWVTFLISPIHEKNQKKIILQYSKVNNELHENVLNVKTIKYLNIYDFSIKRVASSLINLKCVNLTYAKIGIIINILLSVLAYLPYIILLYMGFKGVIDGVITIGTVTALVNYLQQLMQQLTSIKDICIQFQQFKVLNNRLNDILQNNLVDNNYKYGETLLDINSETINMELKDISFGFNDEILFQLNQEFHKGDIILVSGVNGSGKTSLINLICGILVPNRGSITFNDIPLNELTVADKKNIFSIVPQNIELFSGTIRENITLGENIHDDEIIELSKEINFLQVDEKFLDSRVLNRGMNFSGGQMQKIAIIRALMRKSKILILDESSTSLDINSKNKLYQYIEHSKENRITFIISHENENVISWNKRIII